jgi:hypothetical protein
VAGSSEERVVLVDSVSAAVAVDKPASTIRRWAHEGRFERKGTDGGGRALYSLADVYRAAVDVRAGKGKQ